MVRAMSQDGRGGGMTQTDADGRFEIKELLGGRYTLMVTKAGYVGMSYGQRRPEQQGTVLEIIDGTVVDKIAFSLPRGGVITGTVLVSPPLKKRRNLDMWSTGAGGGAHADPRRFFWVSSASRLR